MLRVSLAFVLLAALMVPAADLSITTLEPGTELRRLGLGFLTPDFLSLREYGSAFFNTISFALVGILLAVIVGTSLSFFFHLTPVRLFCSSIRSIHELFWAFIFMPVTGLNSVCGVLAIAVPYAGVFAKVYAEIRQEAGHLPDEDISLQRSTISSFCYRTLPRIYDDLKSYTSYRFECALRSSAILGFIGLPTLGYHLETAFREGMYSEAAALLYIFYLLIVSLRFWARPQLIVVPILLAIAFTSWESSISWGNIIRFFTYDILPWPMRAAGFYDGSQAITFSLPALYQWVVQLTSEQALAGIWNTLVLTQIALVCSAIFTLVVFPTANRHFFNSPITLPAKLLLIILRTTPEYILAYIFLLLWGPSMLPAICALFIHNGAILAHLTSRNVDLIQLHFDSNGKRINRYFFEILPRCYGQFLAFLFYRWEVIMRESAILGILGITTLGYFIDSAIAQDHLDVALFLIVVTALLNMCIDSLSQVIRKKLQLSTSIHCTTPPCKAELF